MPRKGQPPKFDCRMCADPESNRHVEAFAAGEITKGGIAKLYKMSVPQVNTHFDKHVPTALRPAMRRIMMNPDVTRALVDAKTQAAFVLVDKLAALSDRMDELLRNEQGHESCPVCSKALYSPQYQGAIANVAKALLAYLHELGVWTGDIKSTILNINVQNNYIEFKNVIMEVLAEHPEVLEKVEAKLVALELPDGAQN